MKTPFIFILIPDDHSYNCNVAGDLICGEDLDDLLAAGGNSELEIQCCDESKDNYFNTDT